MLLNIAIFISNRNLLSARLQPLIVFLNITDFLARQQFVASLHFIHRPLQSRNGLFRLVNHRRKKMRNISVRRHFDLLRVNQNQLHITRTIAIQQATKQGINHHRLTRTRLSSNQQMRHLSQFTHNNLTGYIFTNPKAQRITSSSPLF